MLIINLWKVKLKTVPFVIIPKKMKYMQGWAKVGLQFFVWKNIIQE